MFLLSHWIYALAVFYGALAVVIIALACRPSCRICLHRGECPNRPVSGPPPCAARKTASITSNDPAET
jgi:hypothetical protein